MSESLFIDPTLSMEKVAYDTRIDDDVEEWPIAVIRESYKQLPFLKGYETEAELDKVDAARGYGVGKLLVWPARMEKGAAAKNKQLVTVPIIIRNREMAPLDVYTYQGAMQAMDQDKVASVLFQPQVFEATRHRKGSSGDSLGEQLTPPNDETGGMSSFAKSASVRLWDAVRPSFRQGDIDRLGEKLASDHGLRYGVLHTPSLRRAVAELAEVSEKTAADRQSTREASLKPTVVQFVEDGTGYLMKTASVHCYAPVETRVSVAQARAALGSSFDRLLEHGHVTLNTTPTYTETHTEKVASVATHVGTYLVASGGETLEGVVIPRVETFDGDAMDCSLFLGAGSHSFQEKVAGVRLGHAQLEGQVPQGMGVFAYQAGEHAIALEPVRIDNAIKVAGVKALLATRMGTGEQIRIDFVPGLRKVAWAAPGALLLPDSMLFIPLAGGKERQVSQDIDEMELIRQEKTAAASAVTVVSSGGSYSLRGDNTRPFPGILNETEAEFALCALGASGQQASYLLKTADARGEARLPRSRAVVLESTRLLSSMVKAASALAPVGDLRVDLVKELVLLTSPPAMELWKQASVVLSKETADTILSLGFVTPENASLYVNYLPDLEKVSSKLAELLVASRLGMDDVRESAAKNAMTQVSAVVRGLETLRQRIS